MGGQVIYLPKKDSPADSINQAMGTYTKVSNDREDRQKKDAAMQLSAIMEMGGVFSSPEEITVLESKLNLQPGTLASSIQTTPDGKVRMPSRLEREGIQQKANLQNAEDVLNVNAPAKTARIVAEKKAVGPVDAANAGLQAGSVTSSTNTANIQAAPSMRKEKVADVKEVGAAQTAVKIDEATRMITVDVEKASKLHEQELKDLLIKYGKDPVAKAQLEKVKIDSANYKDKTVAEIGKIKAEIDKIKADAEESRAKAAIQPSIGKYYESGTELKDRTDPNAKKGGVSDEIKLKDAQETGVTAGVFKKTKKGVEPVSYDPNDPGVIAWKKDMEAKGITVTEKPAMLGGFTGRKTLSISTPPVKGSKGATSSSTTPIKDNPTYIVGGQYNGQKIMRTGKNDVTGAKVLLLADGTQVEVK